MPKLPNDPFKFLNDVFTWQRVGWIFAANSILCAVVWKTTGSEPDGIISILSAFIAIGFWILDEKR